MPHHSSSALPPGPLRSVIDKYVDTLTSSTGSQADLPDVSDTFGFVWTDRRFVAFMEYLKDTMKELPPDETSTLSTMEVYHALAHYALLRDAIDNSTRIGDDEQFLRLVLAYQDSIFFWYNRVLNFSLYPADVSVCRVQYLTLLQGVARDLAVISELGSMNAPGHEFWTPAFIKLFIGKIWHCELPHILAQLPRKMSRSFDRFHITFVPEVQGMCPIIELMWRMIVWNDSQHLRTVFLPTLDENPEIARSLTEGLRKRFRVVEEHAGKCDPKLALRHTVSLTEIFGNLSCLRSQSVGLQEAFVLDCKALTIVGSVEALLTTLTKSDSAPAVNESLVIAAEVVGIIVWVLTKALLSGGWGVSSSSLISTSCSLFSICSRVAGVANVQQKPKWGSVMDAWFGYLHHPDFARGLQKAYLDADAIAGAQSPAPPAIWNSVRSRADGVVVAYDSIKAQGLGLCDNLSCRSKLIGKTSQKCCGCQSIAYCSPECQKEDWALLHRQECSAAKQDRERREFPYTVKARALHAKQLTETLENLSVEWERIRRGEALVVSCIAGGWESTYRRTLGEGGWNVEGLQFEEEHLKTRFHHQTRAFEEAAARLKENVLLVEMVIPFASDTEVRLRCIAHFSNAGEWTIASSVPRIGSPGIPTPEHIDSQRRLIYERPNRLLPP